MLLSEMCTRYSRRDFVRLGGASIGGISLAQLLAASPGRSDVSCLIYFHTGGLCQHDSFDPKPEAPREVRGGFGTVPTSVPGVRFSELLPRSAANFERFAVIRSMFFLGSNPREGQAVCLLRAASQQRLQAPCVRLGGGSRARQPQRLAAVRRDSEEGHLRRRRIPGVSLRPLHRRRSLQGAVLGAGHDPADGPWLGRSAGPRPGCCPRSTRA